jgi:hypothetical protein
MKCKYCGKQATHVAAQSSDAGNTIDVVFICKDEVKGWNEGGDWKAPIFELGKQVPYKATL